MVTRICHRALAQFHSFPECVSPPGTQTELNSRWTEMEHSSRDYKDLGRAGSEQRYVQSAQTDWPGGLKRFNRRSRFTPISYFKTTHN